MIQLGKSLRTALMAALRPIPMPLLAMGIGLCAGLAVWGVLDQLQSRSVNKIFQRELRAQMDQRAREHLSNFAQYLESYSTTVRLLASHRGLAQFLQDQFWLPGESAAPLKYWASRPPWLPDPAEWNALIAPTQVLLTDRDGGIREVFAASGKPLPAALPGRLGEPFLSATETRTLLTRLDGQPTLIVSDAAEDADGYPMGYLVILVAVDAQFLTASQKGMSLTNATLALVDADDLRVLVSTGAQQALAGSRVDRWGEDYEISFQALAEHEGPNWNLMFATFIPHDLVAALVKRVTQFEERQRVITALAFVAMFTLVIYLVSARLNRVLMRMARFSRRVLGIDQLGPEPSANQLLVLEERMGQFSRLVLQMRREMRQRHASAIQRNEALKSAVLEAARDGIITIDEQGGIVECNRTAERLLGIERGQVMGRRFPELFIVPEDRDRFESLWHASSGPSTGSTPESTPESPPLRHAQTELSLLRADHQRVPMEVTLVPLLFGERHLYTLYLHDISERLKADREIKSLARFASESPNPTLRVTRQGTVIYANAASLPLMAYWGCRRGQTLPVYWRGQIARALEANRDLEYEVDCDGQVYALVLAPVVELDYVNLYGRDVTEARRAEQESRQHQAELVHVCRLSTLGEVATGMAHELNQPLAAIVNYANGCSRRLHLGSAGKKELLAAMRQITLQAERASEIIRRLRGLVGKQLPTRSRVDLNQLVREVCSFVEYECSRLGVTIELDLSSEPLRVDVDLVQIEQVLLNLVRNGLDSLEGVEAGRRMLKIHSASVGTSALVKVSDSGPGVAPECLDHLFEPFFTTKASGMGMGLPISLTIVQDHGGRIWATSEPGAGADFHVELPCVEAPGQAARGIP